MFDNYSDNEEFSLKEQKIINRVTNSTVRAYMEENAQVLPQGKAYQQYLENRKYVQQDHVRSKLKGNVVFNPRDVTYRINSSKLKTQFRPVFTSNHKEADTKIVFAATVLTNHA